MLLAELRTLWLALARMMFDGYQPERHYMRGKGPKSQARMIFGDAGLHSVLVNVSAQSAEVERLLRNRSQ